MKTVGEVKLPWKGWRGEGEASPLCLRDKGLQSMCVGTCMRFKQASLCFLLRPLVTWVLLSTDILPSVSG